MLFGFLLMIAVVAAGVWAYFRFFAGQTPCGCK